MKESDSTWRLLIPCVLLVFTLGLLFAPINPKVPQVGMHGSRVIFVIGSIFFFLFELSEIRRARREKLSRSSRNQAKVPGTRWGKAQDLDVALEAILLLRTQLATHGRSQHSEQGRLLILLDAAIEGMTDATTVVGVLRSLDPVGRCISDSMDHQSRHCKEFERCSEFVRKTVKGIPVASYDGMTRQ